jgi:hypothetical protein
VSGETEENVSGWTVDTLRLSLEAQISHMRFMLQERYETQTKAVEAAFRAQETAMAAALTSAEKAVQTALAAAEKAVVKAEIAAEKRFDGANEFRGQMNDMIATLMPRREAEQRIDQLHEKNTTTAVRLESLTTRGELGGAIAGMKDALDAHHTELQSRLDSSGRRLGELAEDLVALKLGQSRMAALEELVKIQKERLDKAEGNSAGSLAAWGWLAAAVSLIITVVTIANILTTAR